MEDYLIDRKEGSEEEGNFRLYICDPAGSEVHRLGLYAEV